MQLTVRNKRRLIIAIFCVDYVELAVRYVQLTIRHVQLSVRYVYKLHLTHFR
jgi:hypothetical protein